MSKDTVLHKGGIFTCACWLYMNMNITTGGTTDSTDMYFDIANLTPSNHASVHYTHTTSSMLQICVHTDMMAVNTINWDTAYIQLFICTTDSQNDCLLNLL